MKPNRLSVAPMVNWTDRHCRYWMRLVAPHALLHTEMLVDQAVCRGFRHSILGFNPREQPVVAQLAGAEAHTLARAAKLVVDFGYAGVNLNVGCPSPRVKAGGFGAVLMERPELVVELVRGIRDAVDVPVSVKCRIGTERRSSYAEFRDFVAKVLAAGADYVVVHARIAVLAGLSTRQNLNVPELRYDYISRLKRECPASTLVLNGGITSVPAALEHLTWADGVMIGRTAYHRPEILAEMDAQISGNISGFDPLVAISSYVPYMAEQLRHGVPIAPLLRPLHGLFHGYAGAKKFRARLADFTKLTTASAASVWDAVRLVDLSGLRRV